MTLPRHFTFWAYGDKKYTKLTASIDDLDSSVYDLKRAILDVLNSQLKGEIQYSCDSINLYEAGYPYGSLKEELKNFMPRYQLRMEGIRTVSYYFPQGPERHQLHIIAQPPPTIYCWRFGDKFSQYFKIHIDYRKCPTSRLKEAIHKKMRLHSIDVADIELFKVSIPLKRWKGERVAVKLNDSLHPGLSNVFHDAPSQNHLHIIVLLPQDRVCKPKETFTITDHSITEVTSKMNKQFQRLTIYLNECPSAKHLFFKDSQRDLPLIDGSVDPGNPSASTGPPIQLFHTTFGHFLDDLSNENLLVPDAFLRKTVQFMRNSSRIYKDRDTHMNMIKQTFQDLLGIVEDQSSSHDGIAFTSKSGIGIMIVESAQTLGHGLDPATQACFSMTRYWMNPLRQNLRRETCCPTFLVAVGGPWLTIIGGIMTEYAVFQRLTDYVWLGIDSAFSDPHYRRVGRIMYALKRALSTLDDHYLALSAGQHAPESSPPRLFSFEPSIDSYLNEDGTLVKFKYTSKREASPGCVTFLGETKTEEPRRIIVKFVERYNADAHKLVATAGLAPALYYCGKVGVRAGDPSYGSLKMVVVEFIQGSTLYNRQAFPTSIVGQIKRALEVLHNNGYVFGNLRRPNILITADDQVKLINFELTGLEGKDRYPFRIAPLDEFANGTQGYSLLKTQDDFDMLAKVAARPTQETGLPLTVKGRRGYFY